MEQTETSGISRRRTTPTSSPKQSDGWTMKTSETPGEGEKVSRNLDATPESSDAISQRLRHFYESVQEETIPDRFLELLEMLGEAEERQAARNNMAKG